MPQAPLPNTGVVLPSDHGDGDTWNTILDDAFRNYDQHNHAHGAGAQVLLSSLAIDADMSWISSDGTKRAITDLKAIDFFPVDPTTVTALTGALFLSNVDNELYYRTFFGVNVKLTNGAAINFAQFVGGIAGDYGAVGALESYDDATTAYVFQQELGAAVRQYAKLRSADLLLYEYKVHGTAGVPLTSVTIRSPTGLAGNYALTLPGALPGVSGTLIQSDNAGILSFSNAGLTLASPSLSGTPTFTGSPTLAAGQTMTITDGATALKGMTSTHTQGIDLSDCLIISGSIASQPSPALVGITIPALTTYSYRWRHQPSSHETMTAISAVFSDSTNAVHVSSVTLKYMDHGYSKTTITGISFTQIGQSWVMSGVPSVTLNGPAGRVYFMEVATTGVGSATWYAIETTTTT